MRFMCLLLQNFFPKKKLGDLASIFKAQVFAYVEDRYIFESFCQVNEMLSRSGLGSEFTLVEETGLPNEKVVPCAKFKEGCTISPSLSAQPKFLGTPPIFSSPHIITLH